MTHHNNHKSDRSNHRPILSEHDRHTQAIEKIIDQYQSSILNEALEETAEEGDPETNEETGQVYLFPSPNTLVEFLEEEVNDYGLLIAARAGSETIAHAAFLRVDYEAGKVRWKGIDRGGLIKFIKDCNKGTQFDCPVIIRLETLIHSDDGSVLRMFGKCDKCNELHITPLRQVQCYVVLKGEGQWQLLKRPGSAIASEAIEVHGDELDSSIVFV